MEEVMKGQYAIIPANVRYDKDLTANAKLLYGEITALSSESGSCWATNQYFAELYGVSKRSITNWINLLKDKGYITVKNIYKDGTKEIEKRCLYPMEKIFYTPRKKLLYPMEKNFYENNTSINNKKKIYKRKVVPEWFNEDITSKELTEEDIENMDDLKDFLKKV
jgi:DNA-binding transcriptional ArsR family regulator